MSCSVLSSQIPLFSGRESWGHMEHQDKIEDAEVCRSGYKRLQISKAKPSEGILLFHITLKRTLRDTKVSLESRAPLGFDI